MDKKINVLIIDDEGPVDPVAVARCFSNTPHVTIHVITRRNWKQTPYKYSRYIKKVHCFSPENDRVYLSQIIDTLKTIESPILFPLTAKAQLLILENIDAFTGITKVVPLSDMKVIETVENKWTLNKFLRENNFPYANFMVFDTLQNVRKNIPQLKTPFLLKPVIGVGGEGIVQFDNHEDALAHVNSHDINCNAIIFQEYINGYTIDISLLAERGEILAHSIQKGLVPPMIKFSFTPGIEFLNNEELLALARQIISKLNFSGVANLDFCYDTKEKNYKLVDFNARFWSTLLGSHAVGINFPYLTCLTALGIPFAPPTYSNEKFLLTKAAIIETVKNLTRKEKLAFSFKQTSFKYIIRDPFPEIVKAFLKLFRI